MGKPWHKLIDGLRLPWYAVELDHDATPAQFPLLGVVDGTDEEVLDVIGFDVGLIGFVVVVVGELGPSASAD